MLEFVLGHKKNEQGSKPGSLKIYETRPGLNSTECMVRLCRKSLALMPQGPAKSYSFAYKMMSSGRVHRP